MAGQVVGLPEEVIPKIQELLDLLPILRLVRTPKRPPAPSGPNRQIVRISSATLDTTDPNEDRYPGHWYLRQQETGEVDQQAEIWIVGLNGEKLEEGKYYEGDQHGIANGRGVFTVNAVCCGTDEAIVLTETQVEFDEQKNNLVVDDDVSLIIATGDGGFDFTGITAPDPEITQVIYFRNDSSGNITITHNDGDSTEGNRFFTLTGEPAVVIPGEEYKFTYDTTNEYWIVTSEGLPTTGEMNTLTLNPATDAGVPLTIQQNSATQSGDLFIITNHDGTVIYSGANEDGYIFTGKTSAPADGDISNSQIYWYMDDTTSAGKVLFKGKDDSGNVFTITVANQTGINTWTGSNTISGASGVFIFGTTSDKDTAPEGRLRIPTITTESGKPTWPGARGEIVFSEPDDTLWAWDEAETDWKEIGDGGGGGGVSGSGTANTVAKWSSSSALTDSLITDDGATIKVGDNLNAVIVDTVGTINLVATAGIITVGGSGGSDQVGFFGSNGATKPTVSGSKGGNAALGSLISALSSLGLITDSSS